MMKWQEYLHITRGDLFLVVMVHREHVLPDKIFHFRNCCSRRTSFTPGVCEILPSASLGAKDVCYVRGEAEGIFKFVADCPAAIIICSTCSNKKGNRVSGNK